MFSGLTTSNMTPGVVNRHQADKMLIACRNPNNTPLTVIGAPGQLQPTAIIQGGTGQSSVVFIVKTGIDTGTAFQVLTKAGVQSFSITGQGQVTLDTINGGSPSLGFVCNSYYSRFIGGGGSLTDLSIDNSSSNTSWHLFVVGASGSNGATSGQFGIGQAVSGTNSSGYVLLLSTTTQNVLIQASGATVIPLVVKGAVSQSGDLFQVQKSDGTVYYKLDKLSRPVTSNTTPTIAAGVGAGTSPTISITGTDVNGIVTLTSGTLPTGAAVVATITFSSAFGATPKTVMLTPANANAAALNALTMVWVDSAGLSTASWTINAGATGLGAATAYIWYYQVLG